MTANGLCASRTRLARRCSRQDRGGAIHTALAHSVGQLLTVSFRTLISAPRAEARPASSQGMVRPGINESVSTSTWMAHHQGLFEEST